MKRIPDKFKDAFIDALSDQGYEDEHIENILAKIEEVLVQSETAIRAAPASTH